MRLPLFGSGEDISWYRHWVEANQSSVARETFVVVQNPLGVYDQEYCVTKTPYGYK